MKRRNYCFLIFLCFFLCVGVGKTWSVLASEESDNTSKENAIDFTKEKVTGKLESKSQKRWYKFEVERKSDVIFCFFNESKSPYVYCWNVDILKEDGDSVVSGSVERDKMTRVKIRDAQGIYYVQVSQATGGNPLLNGFSDDPFSISLISDMVLRSGSEVNGVFSIEKENSVICSLDGKLFLKKNDGVAMAGYYSDSSKNTGPILVSRYPDAVEYYSTGWTEDMQWNKDKYNWNPKKFYYHGEVYYYSSNIGFVEGIYADTMEPPLYRCGLNGSSEAEAVAREILDTYYGWEKPGQEEWLKKDLSESTMPIMLLGGLFIVSVGLVLLAIAAKLKGKGISYSKTSSSGSGNTSSYRSSTTANEGYNSTEIVVMYRDCETKGEYIGKYCGSTYSDRGIETIRNDESLSAEKKDELERYYRIYTF